MPEIGGGDAVQERVDVGPGLLRVLPCNSWFAANSDRVRVDAGPPIPDKATPSDQQHDGNMAAPATHKDRKMGRRFRSRGVVAIMRFMVVNTERATV